MTVAGPLEGLRVLEFGQIAAGPFLGMLLADLGADVVKVERPGAGDGMRDWPPLMGENEDDRFSANFASLNRNKRSIAVDLKDPADVARLRSLCGRADIIVENFRPGVLRRLGLGYEDLREHNPRLVYCSISGYGQIGPDSQKGAFDVTVQAISGVMSVTGEGDRPPSKCGVPIGDFCAGLYAAYSIMAALRRAESTGLGAQIDCSMLGSLLGMWRHPPPCWLLLLLLLLLIASRLFCTALHETTDVRSRAVLPASPPCRLCDFRQAARVLPLWHPGMGPGRPASAAGRLHADVWAVRADPAAAVGPARGGGQPRHLLHGSGAHPQSGVPQPGLR